MSPTHAHLHRYVRDWVANFPVSLLDPPKRSHFVRAMNSPEVRGNHRFLSALAWQLYGARLELQALRRAGVEVSGYEVLRQAWYNALFEVSVGDALCQQVEQVRLPGNQPAAPARRPQSACPDCQDPWCFGSITATSFGDWVIVPVIEHVVQLCWQRACTQRALYEVPVEIADE